jgi:hypothetical protein
MSSFKELEQDCLDPAVQFDLGTLEYSTPSQYSKLDWHLQISSLSIVLTNFGTFGTFSVSNVHGRTVLSDLSR